MANRTGFDPSLLRQVGRSCIKDMLTSQRGRKHLFFDPQIKGHINQLLYDEQGIKLIKEYNVVEIKMIDSNCLNLRADSSTGTVDCILIIVRPNIAVIKQIAKLVRNHRDTGYRGQTHLYFVPHNTQLCTQLLQDMKVWDYLETHELDLGFASLDSDILSLLSPDYYKQTRVDMDTTPVAIAAHGLAQLQAIYGVIPHLKAVGSGARQVLQRTMHLRCEASRVSGNSRDEARREPTQPEVFPYDGCIDTLVILDREVDLASVLTTPLTYEGIIEEVVGLNDCIVQLDQTLVEEDTPGTSVTSVVVPGSGSTSIQPVQGKSRVSVTLTDEDAMYADTRNLSVERLGGYLRERTLEVREIYTSFRENKDQSISDIHAFMYKKMPQLKQKYKSLQLHVNIAALVKQTSDSREFRDSWQLERSLLEGDATGELIEDMICADVDRAMLPRVLRLLCLQSVTAGGIRTARLEAVRRLIGQTYGYEQLFTLVNLERAGLIRRKDALFEGVSQWQTARKTLHLITEEGDGGGTGGTEGNGSAPSGVGAVVELNTLYRDMSYVTAGYAPLSVRIVQAMSLRQGSSVSHVPSWATTQDVLKQLLGSGSGPTAGGSGSLSMSMSMGVSAGQYTQTGVGGNSAIHAPAAQSVPMSLVLEVDQRRGRPEELLTALERSQAEQTQSAVSSGVTGASSLLSALTSSTTTSTSQRLLHADDITHSHDSRKPVMLVCMLGGLSYVELAAFRHISRDPRFPYTLILAGTSFTGGTRFLQTLTHKFK